MENKKILISLTLLVVILGWALTSIIAYLMGFKKGQVSIPIRPQEIQSDSFLSTREDLSEDKKNKSDYVSIKDSQFENILGKIDSINSEKLTLKSTELGNNTYEIERNSIHKIILMKKNPLFDEAKLTKMQNELNSLLPPAPQSSEQNNSEDSPLPEIPEEARIKMEEFQKDPTLKMFDEKEASWDELKSGMQINLTNQNNERKITVYPVEI